MNCVLHFINRIDDIKNVEHNYKTLSSVVDKHFLITFNPNVLPQGCNFEQIFCQKIDFVDEWHLDYHLYFLKMYITKYLLLKRYKRIMFISSNLKIKNVDNLLSLYNSIRADSIDLIKFKHDDHISRDIYIMRLKYLNLNLNYARCSYEEYCKRDRIYGHYVYAHSPYHEIKILNDYI
jgi:hypothetical protein